MTVMDENKIIDLLKAYYEASSKGQQAETELFLHIITRFGKNLEEFKEFRKKQPTRHGTEIYLKHLCPLVSCGDKPMQKKSNRYVCSICRLSFDAKIWDNALKAINEYMSAGTNLYNGLEKMQKELPDNRDQQIELHQKLSKKYNKEKWWYGNIVSRHLFGWSH